jgi:hypothetical protein
LLLADGIRGGDSAVLLASLMRCVVVRKRTLPAMLSLLGIMALALPGCGQE